MCCFQIIIKLSGNVAQQGLNHMDDVGLPQLEEDEMHDTHLSTSGLFPSGVDNLS